MIELRWRIRPGWDGPEKVLEYRQYVDTTVYAQDPGGYVFPPVSKMEWSKWKEVPEFDDTK